MSKASLILSAVSNLATFLTMFIVLFTLLEMAKQRRSAYRPDIIITPPHYFVYCRARHKRILSMTISSEELSEFGTSDRQRHDVIGLSGFNIGLGSAKSIDVTWDYSIHDLIRSISERDTKGSFTIHKLPGSLLSLEIPEVMRTMSNTDHQESFDYLLPTHVTNEAIQIRLPPAYLSLTSALLCLQWATAEHWDTQISQLPLVRMSVRYTDIGNNRHEKSFSIQPILIKESKKEPDSGEVMQFGGMITCRIHGGWD